MRINRQDTNGVKPLLQTGELGFDNFASGGDIGRVYVGTGSSNIAQAKKSEVVTVDGKVDTHVARIDNPHAVTKAQVGLGNVQDVDTTNASNITSGTLANARLANSGVTAGTYKSVTVDGKGIVTGGTNPTTISGYGITDTYTKTETNTQISTAVNGLVDAAPGTLDTLNELAAALGDDPNFATTIANSIGTKVTKVTSTDNAIVRFDGIIGSVQDSSVTINDSGQLAIGGATFGSEINVDSVSAKEYAGISLYNTKYTNSTSYVDAGKSIDIRDSAIFFIHNTDNSSNITFSTQNSGTNTDRILERLRIGADGDIGIGKISAGNKVAIKQRINSSTGGISIENVTGTATAVVSVLDTGQLILRNNATDTLSIANGNTLHISPNGAIGYGAGAGGTVIQATSKTTAVTLNKPSGRITTHNQAMSAGSNIYFGVYNSVVGINDSIIITQNDMSTYSAANYNIKVVYQANGLIGIDIRNISAYTLSDAIVINFAVIKGAIA